MALVESSLIDKECAQSREAREHVEWDPEWITNIFTCWLKCSNASCSDDNVITGIGGIELQQSVTYVDDNPEFDEQWIEYYSPRYCSTMPDIIRMPEKCPTDVTKELRASFALFWSDQSASANRLRIAVECLMNHIGVAKNGPSGADLTLHDRIKLFSTQDPISGMQLMALKWLGNTGSHIGEVSKSDMLDAYEVFEHALAELIDQRTQKVAELARQISNKHEPKRKPKSVAPTVPPSPNP